MWGASCETSTGGWEGVWCGGGREGGGCGRGSAVMCPLPALSCVLHCKPVSLQQDQQDLPPLASCHFSAGSHRWRSYLHTPVGHCASYFPQDVSFV